MRFGPIRWEHYFKFANHTQIGRKAFKSNGKKPIQSEGYFENRYSLTFKAAEKNSPPLLKKIHVP